MALLIATVLDVLPLPFAPKSLMLNVGRADTNATCTKAQTRISSSFFIVVFFEVFLL
jgi:hypothetical protein